MRTLAKRTSQRGPRKDTREHIKSACQVYRRVLCDGEVLRSGEQLVCSAQKVSGFAAEFAAEFNGGFSPVERKSKNRPQA